MAPQPAMRPQLFRGRRILEYAGFASRSLAFHSALSEPPFRFGENDRPSALCSAAHKRVPCSSPDCSSNLRLRSDVAPLNVFTKYGVTVGMGLDEAGMDDDVPTCAQILKMANEDGAYTTPFGRGKRRLLICDHDRSQRLRSSRSHRARQVRARRSPRHRTRSARGGHGGVAGALCASRGTGRDSLGDDGDRAPYAPSGADRRRHQYQRRARPGDAAARSARDAGGRRGCRTNAWRTSCGAPSPGYRVSASNSARC
ncbi:hypothetical protein P3T21_007731 [Paraburkholderia sp. GAS334]